MDVKSVERLILLSCQESFSRSNIALKFFWTGVRWLLLAIIIVWVSLRSDFVTEGLETLWFLIAVGVLVLVSVVWAGIHLNRRIKNIFEEQIQKNSQKITGFVALGCIVGMYTSRLLQANFPEVVPIVLFIAVGIFLLMIFLCVFLSFSKVYLIKKYCPYLITPEDRRYNHDVEIIISPESNSKPSEERINIRGKTYGIELTELDLSGNHLGDGAIIPIKNMKNLTMLNLSDNQIRDIRPLTELTNLKILELHNNEIGDLTPLANLTNLEILTLQDNKITDWSPVAHVSNVVGRP